MMRFAVDILEDRDEIEGAVEPRARTPVVLGLLALAALVFSYLGAYALTDALRAADVLAAWPAGEDPRPRWMLVSFACLMGTFMFLGALFRMLSWRQLRKLDALADETEEFRISDV